MRFFLKATTRLPLKIVSSVFFVFFGGWVGRQSPVQNVLLVGRLGKLSNKPTSFMCRHTNLSSQTQRACQISAGTAAGAPQPVGCPCSSAEPYPKPCWNSRSQPMPGPACKEGPGQIKQTEIGKNVLLRKWKNAAACSVSLMIFYPLIEDFFCPICASAAFGVLKTFSILGYRIKINSDVTPRETIHDSFVLIAAAFTFWADRSLKIFCAGVYRDRDGKKCKKRDNVCSLPDTKLWFFFIHWGWKKKTCVKKCHLGSLNVSHVIPQQLCELQFLVRCNSSFHFLQGAQTLASYHNLFTRQDKHWQSCLGLLQIEWSSTYSELLEQVWQLLEVPDEGRQEQNG